MILRSAASIWAKSSGFRRFCPLSTPPLTTAAQNWCTPAPEPDKQESDQFSRRYGAYPKTRDPAEPRARDDAAADAGHQAAAALESGPRQLRGDRARAKPPARAPGRRGGRR